MRLLMRWREPNENYTNIRFLFFFFYSSFFWECGGWRRFPAGFPLPLRLTNKDECKFWRGGGGGEAITERTGRLKSSQLWAMRRTIPAATRIEPMAASKTKPTLCEPRSLAS